LCHKSARPFSDFDRIFLSGGLLKVGPDKIYAYAAANKLRSTFYILWGSRAVLTCTYSSTSQHLYAAANKFRSAFYILRHSLAAYASRCEHLAQRLCIGCIITLPRFFDSDQKQIEKIYRNRIQLKIGLNLLFSTKGDLCPSSDDFKFSALYTGYCILYTGYCTY
jgi:hypothetical protein